jgi:hypothetical protein
MANCTALVARNCNFSGQVSAARNRAAGIGNPGKPQGLPFHSVCNGQLKSSQKCIKKFRNYFIFSPAF